MYFSCTFASLLRRKEAVLSQSSLLRESYDKFAPKCKFLTSSSEAILIYRPLKNTFLSFYKRDSATFKLLNCLVRILEL